MTSLKDFQLDVVQFMLSNPYAGLFLEMGSGKTIITLTALQKMLINKEISRVLIISSLRVCNCVWQQEAKKFEHTRSLKIEAAIGDKKKRDKVFNGNADIVLINKENTQKIIDEKHHEKFDCLVIDESTAFKNYKSKRFKALKAVLGGFKKRYILTGTPYTESFIDLWSQIFILDCGYRLEKFISHFQNIYFYLGDQFNYYKHTIKENASEVILDKIQDITITRRLRDYCDVQEPLFVNFRYRLSLKISNYYKAMKKEYSIMYKFTIKNDIITNIKTISAVSASSVANKLHQICCGAVYNKNKDVVKFGTDKAEALVEVCEELQENVLVAIKYKFDFEIIKKVLPHAVLFNDNLIDKWNNGKIKIMCINPQSAGHGLNLQFGGHNIVWYTLTHSSEQYQQLNARLMRPGQKTRVRITHLMAENTLETGILDAVNEKITISDVVMDTLSYA